MNIVSFVKVNTCMNVGTIILLLLLLMQKIIFLVNYFLKYMPYNIYVGSRRCSHSNIPTYLKYAHDINKH